MTRHERLRQHSLEAAKRYARNQDESLRQSDEVQPGEVYAFSETAASDVLWTVIERGDEDPPRWLALATDLHPFVGTSDVGLPPDSACGPLSLRCGVALRLGGEAFASATRTESLEDESLARVRRKRGDIVAGEEDLSPLRQETDEDPEYQVWMEEVVKARQTLAAATRLPEVKKPAKVLPFPPPASQRAFGHPWSLAATVLLAVLLGRLVWQGRQLAITQQENDGLRGELLAFEPETVLTNRIVLSRSPMEDERGPDEYPPPLPTAQEYFTLVLWVEESYPRYQLTIRNWETKVEVERRDGLEEFAESYLSVVLKLPAGEYRLDLDGIVDDKIEPVAQYALLVEEE